MATRLTLLSELRNRLGEMSDDVWTSAELKGFIDFGIKALYPYFFQHNTDTTVAASDGPIQAMPAGASNLYSVGVIKDGATRVRPIRGWTEGDGTANVPKLGITGQTLVWSWTAGWDAPATDATALTIPVQAEEVVIIRAQITALERVLSDRTKKEKYFAAQVRQGITETDIIDSLDALHATLKEHLDRAMQLPNPVR